jgi:hypothetical protein
MAIKEIADTESCVGMFIFVIVRTEICALALLRHTHRAIERFIGGVCGRLIERRHGAQLRIRRRNASLWRGHLLGSATKDTDFPFIARQVPTTWTGML